MVGSLEDLSRNKIIQMLKSKFDYVQLNEQVAKYLIEKFNVAIITSIALVIILLNVFCNFSSVNESNNFLVKDYTNNVLDNLPKNSILFS